MRCMLAALLLIALFMTALSLFVHFPYVLFLTDELMVLRCDGLTI